MTNSNNTDQAFWDLAEQFIDRANGACAEQDPSLVSAALLEAAARFNAFAVAAASLDRKAFIEDMEPSLRFLSNRYRERLDEHLQDYRENYKRHIGTDNTGGDSPPDA